jgi:hypothetical protein
VSYLLTCRFMLKGFVFCYRPIPEISILSDSHGSP